MAGADSSSCPKGQHTEPQEINAGKGLEDEARKDKAQKGSAETEGFGKATAFRKRNKGGEACWLFPPCCESP